MFDATDRIVTMVKQKNHTNRNQSFKAHRNGIKKTKRQRFSSLKGVSWIGVLICYVEQFPEYIFVRFESVLILFFYKQHNICQHTNKQLFYERPLHN